MNYEQIKHKVIDTADLVSKVTPNIMPSFTDRYLIPPTYLVGNYISRQRERKWVHPFHGIPAHHPDIEYVPHSLMISEEVLLPDLRAGEYHPCLLLHRGRA